MSAAVLGRGQLSMSLKGPQPHDSKSPNFVSAHGFRPCGEAAANCSTMGYGCCDLPAIYLQNSPQQGVSMRSRPLSVLAACAVVATLSAPLAAQDAGFGARSGVATGGLSGLEGARARPGVAIGPTFGLPVTRWLGVQTELVYTTYGAWLSDATALQLAGQDFTQASFRFLQMPLLARLDVGALLHAPIHAVLYGGPHASAMLECRLTVAAPLAERVPCGASPSSPFAGMNTFQMGAMSGASIAGELFNLFVLGADVRYQWGFNRFGMLYGGFRPSTWAFEIRVSGIGGGGGRYTDLPVPPAIQDAQLTPPGGRPVKGVRM
jgi:hypothetical protein